MTSKKSEMPSNTSVLVKDEDSPNINDDEQVPNYQSTGGEKIVAVSRVSTMRVNLQSTSYNEGEEKIEESKI
jgi:hypothetical protein